MDKEEQALIMELRTMKQDCNASEDMLAYAKKLLQKAKKNNNSYCEMIAIYFQSLYYYKKGDIDTSMKFALLANEMSEKYIYEDYFIITNNMLGIIYCTISDQFLGLDYFLKGYYAADRLQDFNQMSRILNNIGNIFHSLEVYDEAVKYYLKAKEYREKIENYKDEIFNTIMINLIEIYMLQENEEEAVKFIAEIEGSITEVDREILQSIVLSSEILYCFKNGHEVLTKEKIKKLFQKAKLYKKYTHIFRTMYRIKNVIYDLKDKKVGDDYIHFMKLLNDNIEDSICHMQYQDILIEYYDSLDMKDKWYDALNDYHTYHHNNVKLWKTNYSRSLLAKIQLEETLHEKEVIIEKNKVLQKLSEEDELTGIYNRRAVEKKIEESLNSSNNSVSALLIIDVDCFKHVNDHHGHIAGDKVLGKVGRLLGEYFDDDAIVGRLGGDEFIVFIPEVGEDIAKARENISNNIEKFQLELNKIKIKNSNKCISVSVGASLVFNQETTFKALYSSSDNALYKAKNNGKNCYVILEEKKGLSH